jgi:hypothetical protein
MRGTHERGTPSGAGGRVLRFAWISVGTPGCRVYGGWRTLCRPAGATKRQHVEDRRMGPWAGRCVSVVAVAVLLAAGCSNGNLPGSLGGAPGAPAPMTAAPQMVTGKTAFGRIYPQARAWSQDIEFLTLKADDIPGFTGDKGLAGKWEATFASPSLHEYKVYTYAIATVLPDVHKGVSAGLPLAWRGETRDAMAIDMSMFSVDSDAAYQAAAADAKAWLAKNQDKPLSALALGRTYKFGGPVWLATWGDAKKGGYAVFVDASSGKVYKSK